MMRTYTKAFITILISIFLTNCASTIKKPPIKEPPKRYSLKLELTDEEKRYIEDNNLKLIVDGKEHDFKNYEVKNAIKQDKPFTVRILENTYLYKMGKNTLSYQKWLGYSDSLKVVQMHLNDLLFNLIEPFWEVSNIQYDDFYKSYPIQKPELKIYAKNITTKQKTLRQKDYTLEKIKESLKHDLDQIVVESEGESIIKIFVSRKEILTSLKLEFTVEGEQQIPASLNEYFHNSGFIKTILVIDPALSTYNRRPDNKNNISLFATKADAVTLRVETAPAPPGYKYANRISQGDKHIFETSLPVKANSICKISIVLKKIVPPTKQRFPIIYFDGISGRNNSQIKDIINQTVNEFESGIIGGFIFLIGYSEDDIRIIRSYNGNYEDEIAAQFARTRSHATLMNNDYSIVIIDHVFKHLESIINEVKSGKKFSEYAAIPTLYITQNSSIFLTDEERAKYRIMPYRR